MMLWRGLKECAGEWEGKERPGQAGVESWLPTMPCCQEHVCVLLGSLFFFLSPFNESNTDPMESSPTKSWPPKTWRPSLRYLHLLNPVGYATDQRWVGEVGRSLLWLLAI